MGYNEADVQNEKISGNESINNDAAPVSGKKSTLTIKIIGLVSLATCLLALITYSLVRKEPEVKNIPEPEKEITAVIEERTLVFEPFIVPFQNIKDHTYIVVEVTFDIPDKMFKSEIIEKRNQLRAIIYDIILNEIKRTETIPSPAELKRNINREISAVLEYSKINEVFVTKFFAV